MVEESFKRNTLSNDFSRNTLEKIGDFVCMDMIGTGPMGSVYRCEHPIRKHPVAIKILTANAPDARGFIKKEYDNFNTLNHPAFVKVFSYGEHEGRPYVVMEYLPGESLQSWMTANSVPMA